ncbi:LacI family DNA-binding transcriptional regulator [Vibrio sp. TH_r3]|uniref:LacI family DNA-binding transcriptional regulator n=1 Tax=Vibrio sp. TH_r3 TaxID=3082084 RepID=UPI0029551ABA|nr:LacI family DNA-binding transcriptional regulator [Vibrio sp. TH_r3]MDV7105547.1 LacI family DNA-binding transcriptional regulator [Vibrio sp. TH_r3]
MPTIKDVAKLAGVSTATVSRTMMHPDKVSEKTRRKVELAIAQSGFSPNAMARSLRRSESKTVVIIVPDIANMFFANIVRGIQSVALDHGYKVLLGDSIHTVEQAKVYLDLVSSKQADGIISLTSELPKDIRQGTSIPMVMACEYFLDFPIPTVRVDNRSSAKRAVDYLIDIGHSKIGCISGPYENPLCIDRKAGYADSLANASIAFDEQAFEEGDFSFQSGFSAFMRLYQTYSMTALFCFNDMMALGAMKAAMQLGVKVPDELSIVGFDDLPFSDYVNPELTTIRQPQEKIGIAAMQVMLKILNGGKVPQDTIIPTQLLVRSSCSVPKI